jgi:hypothetical protein
MKNKTELPQFRIRISAFAFPVPAACRHGLSACRHGLSTHSRRDEKKSSPMENSAPLTFLYYIELIKHSLSRVPPARSRESLNQDEPVSYRKPRYVPPIPNPKSTAIYAKDMNTRSNPLSGFKPIQTDSKQFKAIQTKNHFRPFPTISNHFQPQKASSLRAVPPSPYHKRNIKNCCTLAPNCTKLRQIKVEKRVVVGEGFEPSKAKPADLQSALVDHLSILPRRS